MQLTIQERSQILSLIPKQESFEMLKILRKFREALSLGQEEMNIIRWRKQYKCPSCGAIELLPEAAQCGKCNVWVEETGIATWDTEADPRKDVFIPPAVMSLLTVTLKKLSDNKRLPDELVDLYARFIVGKEQENGKASEGNSQ